MHIYRREPARPMGRGGERLARTRDGRRTRAAREAQAAEGSQTRGRAEGGVWFFLHA